MNTNTHDRFCSKWKIDEVATRTLIDVVSNNGLVIVTGGSMAGKSTFARDLIELVDTRNQIISLPELVNGCMVRELFKLAEAGDVPVIGELHSVGNARSAALRLWSLWFESHNDSDPETKHVSSIFSDCRNGVAVVGVCCDYRSQERRVEFVSKDDVEIYRSER